MSAATSRLANRALFFALWLLLISISVHDAYLLWANRLDIEHLERNPLGLFLLDTAGGEVWLFVITKLLGTIAAATGLLVLYRLRPRLGWAACLVVTLCQIALLAFLYLT